MDLNQKDNNKKIILVTIFIFLAALSRLLPHIDNFTPIGAMALFGGTLIGNKRNAILLPMASMLLSDLLLQLIYGNGFHNTIIFVYGAFALIGSLGFVLRKRTQRQTIMVASLVGSMIFFLVTNFGVWTTGYYGYTTAGLINCFVSGIPFFRGTVMGDLFYNLLLFGSISIVRWRFPSFVK